MAINPLSVNESFSEHLDNVLMPFFEGGQLVNINGNPHQFYDCGLFYTLRRMEDADETRPAIAFTGTRSDRATQFKCTTDDPVPELAYAHRVDLVRTVFVRVANKRPIPNFPVHMPDQLASEVWGQLYLIVATQADRFSTQDIYRPRLDMFPAQVPDVDWSILRGEFNCEIEVKFNPDQFVA